MDAEWRENLFSKPDVLKLRSAGYDWFMKHKSNNNFVRVPANNLKTMKTNVSTIYAVPSSNTNQSQTWNLAKQRLKSRFDVQHFNFWWNLNRQLEPYWFPLRKKG